MLSCDVPQGSAPMVEISLKVAKIYTNQKKYDCIQLYCYVWIVLSSM